MVGREIEDETKALGLGWQHSNEYLDDRVEWALRLGFKFAAAPASPVLMIFLMFEHGTWHA